MKSRNVEPSYDVAIVGAGIIGASLAWRLAQRGLRVVIFDSGRFGGEASSAGAGMLAPGGEITGDGVFTRLLIHSLSLYPAFVAELSAESGTAIDFGICGATESVEDLTGVARLLAGATLRKSLGIRSARTSPTEMFYPDDAYVDPVHVMAALRIALERRGVEIRENCRVRKVSLHYPGFDVDGTKARTAVIAAGAWSSCIDLGWRSLPEAFPVKGHLLGYWLPARTVGPIRRSGHTYVVQRASGFTIVGASEEHSGFDRTVDPVIVEEIRLRGEALLPILKGMKPAEVWTGLRPGAVKPLFGTFMQTAKDVPLWLAYGHLRNGILSAPATAEKLSTEIVEALAERR